MYIKPPEVKGNIHAVLSPADLAESAVNAATAPTKPPVAVIIYKRSQVYVINLEGFWYKGYNLFILWPFIISYYFLMSRRGFIRVLAL